MWNPKTRANTRVAVLVLASLTGITADAWGDEATGAALVAPKLLTASEPEYPREEEAAARPAAVSLILTLDAAGRVLDAQIATSGGSHFDREALRAAERLVFQPATRDGRAITSRIPFTFRFEPAAPAAVERSPEAVTGELRGDVRAHGEAPIPGALVELVRVPSARAADESVTIDATLRALTDETGKFAFVRLPPGAYRVVLSAPGMQPFASDEQVTAASATEVVYRPREAATGQLDIEVRGERPPREATRRVLQAAELARMPGTNGDALHAVENMPGVARTNGVSSNLVVRGSAPQDTAVFVDGTWLPNAFHFGGVTSVIPTELLQRLDFYPGNFAVEYGRQMGGIVDLGIRSPRKDRLGGLLQFDLIDGRMLAEGPIDRATRFAFAARRSWIDAWIGPVTKSAGGSGFRTAPVYYDYQAMLERDLGSKTSARLLFFGSDDRIALTLASPDASDPIAGGDLSAHDNSFRVQGRIDTRWSEALRFTNMVSWGIERSRFRLGGMAVDTKFHVVNVRSDVRAKLARGVSAVAGLDGLGGLYEVDVLVPPEPPSGQVAGPAFGSPLRRLRGDGRLFRPAGYVMLELAPFDRLKLMPGVRIDYAADNRQWSIDPRLIARLDVTSGFPRTTLKGAVGSFHQPPSPPESVAPFGTPQVRANRAVHTSVGIEQEISRDVEVSFEGFYKRFDDLVTSSAAATASGNTYDNRGSGRAYGSELLLRWKPGGRFFGWIAYTLSRSERRVDDSAPLALFQYDQTHILNALGSYTVGRGWSVGARFRVVSGELFTPYLGGIIDLDAGAYAPIASPLAHSARLATFHSLDLRIDKTWSFDSWRLSAYVDIRNVYNRRNPEAVSYNHNYTQTQTVAGFPILPIVGLRGEL